MIKPQLQDLARVGAKARLDEIDNERDALLKMFPDLRQAAERRPSDASRGKGPSPATQARARRGGMSPEARKAQGLRMKAYWAAKRAEKAASADAAGADGARKGARPRRKGFKR
jgi:hypothetical protein